ncbi:MAG: hypothetical protein M3Z37_08485 [Candidatus Eremiobacteraeota bacterium]|nr:hypothetical protein [Candidatus Eremiobacteraeota bacterium]
MRPTDAPPVPKGKVRQLYPPPPFSADAAEVELDAESDDEARLPQTPARPSSSLFVDDAEELEERRLRARERAEARHRTGLDPDVEAPPPERPDTKPVDDLPGGDEWPAF